MFQPQRKNYKTMRKQQYIFKFKSMFKTLCFKNRL